MATWEHQTLSHGATSTSGELDPPQLTAELKMRDEGTLYSTPQQHNRTLSPMFGLGLPRCDPVAHKDRDLIHRETRPSLHRSFLFDLSHMISPRGCLQPSERFLTGHPSSKYPYPGLLFVLPIALSCRGHYGLQLSHRSFVHKFQLVSPHAQMPFPGISSHLPHSPYDFDFKLPKDRQSGRERSSSARQCLTAAPTNRVPARHSVASMKSTPMSPPSLLLWLLLHAIFSPLLTLCAPTPAWDIKDVARNPRSDDSAWKPSNLVSAPETVCGGWPRVDLRSNKIISCPRPLAAGKRGVIHNEGMEVGREMPEGTEGTESLAVRVPSNEGQPAGGRLDFSMDPMKHPGGQLKT